MRWDRLFGELEGYAEHVRIEERDALVADLREGEWAERGWLDGLTDDTMPVEICVRDVGVLPGRVRSASERLIRLESTTANHVIAVSAVQWVRGADRSPGLRRESVQAQLGWGPVFREAHDERDALTMTLAGGLVLEGTVAAVGRDFVRLTTRSGPQRDVPTRVIRVVTFSR
jgi:hypothetical protein